MTFLWSFPSHSHSQDWLLCKPGIQHPCLKCHFLRIRFSLSSVLDLLVPELHVTFIIDLFPTWWTSVDVKTCMTWTQLTLHPYLRLLSPVTCQFVWHLRIPPMCHAASGSAVFTPALFYSTPPPPPHFLKCVNPPILPDPA